MKQHMNLDEIVRSHHYKMNNMVVKTFCFNPFQVNTYILYDETKEAVVIDPGDYVESEDQQLADFIDKEQLHVKYVINTHPHIDHIAGNRFCKSHFNCKILMHENALPIYQKAHVYAVVFGIDFEEAPPADQFLKDGDMVRFGNQELKVLYTPGHADGSISLYDAKNRMVFVGDVLFSGCIGRTDLPTGSQTLLLQSIHDKLTVLPDETVVFCGHEISTSIGQEKLHNPFIHN